jgi:hypothetical protein
MIDGPSLIAELEALEDDVEEAGESYRISTSEL